MTTSDHKSDYASCLLIGVMQIFRNTATTLMRVDHSCPLPLHQPVQLSLEFVRSFHADQLANVQVNTEMKRFGD